MSRDDGFNIADVSTSQLDDPKFRALWRRLKDQPAMCEAIASYHAIILESWANGDRVTADEAVPVWLTPSLDVLAAMVAVGLLDAEHRIPEHAWESWYRPAYKRREERRESGRKGGLAKAANARPSTATAEPEHSQSSALPVPLPSDTVPTVPSVPTQPADFGKEWRPFLEEWRKRFKHLPSEHQRRVLWDVIDNRPTDAATWLSKVRPGATAFEAVGEVMARWSAFRRSVA